MGSTRHPEQAGRAWGPGVERPMQQLSWRSPGAAASRSGDARPLQVAIDVAWQRPGPWNARTAPPLGVPLGGLDPSTALARIATPPASHAAGPAVSPDARGVLVRERRWRCRTALAPCVLRSTCPSALPCRPTKEDGLHIFSCSASPIMFHPATPDPAGRRMAAATMTARRELPVATPAPVCRLFVVVNQQW